MRFVPLRVGWLIYLLLSLGIILMLVAPKFGGHTERILEPLGATFFAVCVVHLLDHYFSAEDLARRLHEIVERTLTKHDERLNATETLGIRGIYATRGQYIQKYDLAHAGLSRRPSAEDDLFCVGGSLIGILGDKQDLLFRLIKEGYRIKLCLMQPTAWSPLTEKLSKLGHADILSALEAADRLRRKLEAPGSGNFAGSLEIRLHSIVLHDSVLFFSQNISGGRVDRVAWDWNFGTDKGDKPAMVAEAESKLGALLRLRYGSMWAEAQCVLRFEGGATRVNELANLTRG